MRWLKVLWFKLMPTMRTEAVQQAASTARQVVALQHHQQRALEALDRELELYRLSAHHKESPIDHR